MSRANSHEPLRLLPGLDAVTRVGGIWGPARGAATAYRTDWRGGLKLKLIVRCTKVKESSNAEKSSDGGGEGPEGKVAGWQDGR